MSIAGEQNASTTNFCQPPHPRAALLLKAEIRRPKPQATDQIFEIRLSGTLPGNSQWLTVHHFLKCELETLSLLPDFMPAKVHEVFDAQSKTWTMSLTTIFRSRITQTINIQMALRKRFPRTPVERIFVSDQASHRLHPTRYRTVQSVDQVGCRWRNST